MKDCPSCGASLFPNQMECPHCGARAVPHRGVVGWSLILGGALLLATGLFFCFAVLSFAVVAQTALGLAMLLFGLRYRELRWQPGQRS